MHKLPQIHSFHIPVMGLAYTIDSPIKVAKYGISSVVSIVDDFLMEKMNEFYSHKHKLPFSPTTAKDFDYRAKRITSYLNTMNTIVKLSFDKLKSSYTEQQSEFQKYLSLLPEFSGVKREFNKLIKDKLSTVEIRKWIDENIHPGSIDVNIMTKVDKVNYKKNKKLPVEFNDAHAALRGFANSDLESSVVLSAGMNPRLYAYLERFNDFYPDGLGRIKKKIIIKVSDFRSAVIQGKFLAKKGLWVSEFRIESGLNCGGHAFASDGYLLGPILEEFKSGLSELKNELQSILKVGLENKKLAVPELPLPLNITVQGGVGTSDEHDFLLNYYQVNSVGWGSPFLLVPEATTVGQETIELLKKATEGDLFLSNISPLGVPFNNVKGSTNEQIRNKRVELQSPGSACPKQFLALSTEFSERALCTASKKYQKHKLKELACVENRKKLSDTYENITIKSCLCEGLANAALDEYKIKNTAEKQGIVICPGPNIAYYSTELSLSEMTAHIYGLQNVITAKHRPNMFIKELNLYIDYFKNQIVKEFQGSVRKLNRLQTIKENLIQGIQYYQSLFSTNKRFFENDLKELNKSHKVLSEITIPD